MDKKIGLSSRVALRKASSFHAYQSIGLVACCSKYGLLSNTSRLYVGPPSRGSLAMPYGTPWTHGFGDVERKLYCHFLTYPGPEDGDQQAVVVSEQETTSEPAARGRF